MRLLISGYFPGDVFPSWIAHRAAILDLKGWVSCHDHSLVEIVVTGDEQLIDALETACSLGPLDIIVDTISSKKFSHVQAHELFQIVN